MSTDEILIEKNGKKIYWRKLVPKDLEEIKRLTLECVLHREPITAMLKDVYNAKDVLRVVMPLSLYLDVAGHGLEDHIGKSKSFMADIIAVDDGYLKMGIMTALLKKAELVAKENKVRYLTSLSTSLYTQMIAAKLGYKLLKEMKYKDYVDKVTQKMPFSNPLPPHTSCMLHCLDLDQQD